MIRKPHHINYLIFHLLRCIQGITFKGSLNQLFDSPLTNFASSFEAAGVFFRTTGILSDVGFAFGGVFSFDQLLVWGLELSSAFGSNARWLKRNWPFSFTWMGDSNLKSKFWGRSIQLDPVGILTLEFDDGETFQWSKVTTSIYNLILGKLYCEHYGTMRIEGNSEYSCKLKFKEQSIIDRNPHPVHGGVHDKKGRTVATLFGKWDESMHYITGDYSGKGKGTESSEPHLLWKRSKPSQYPTRYNLTSFAITLNELTPGLKQD